MTDLVSPKTFDPPMTPTRILLVGVGGTGAHLARLLARLFHHMEALRIKPPTLCLVDPDRVEPKNIARQLFSPADVGYFKAEVVAKRLSLAFGQAIEWDNTPFDVQMCRSKSPYSTLLIDAVDNHHARNALAQWRAPLLLTCGNTYDSGQVSLGTASREEALRYLEDVERKTHLLGEKDTWRVLPHGYALFPELLEPEADSPVAALSCSDWQEQSVLINDTMALVAARYVQQLLLRQPIQSFLTFVSLSPLIGMKSVPITPNSLRAYLEKTP